MTKKLHNKDYIARDLPLNLLLDANRRKVKSRNCKSIIFDKMAYLRSLFSHQENLSFKKNYIENFYIELKKIDDEMSIEEIKVIAIDIKLKIIDIITSEIKFIDLNSNDVMIKERMNEITILLGDEAISKIPNKIILLQIFKVKLLGILKKISPDEGSNDSGNKSYITR